MMAARKYLPSNITPTLLLEAKIAGKVIPWLTGNAETAVGQWMRFEGNLFYGTPFRDGGYSATFYLDSDRKFSAYCLFDIAHDALKSAAKLQAMEIEGCITSVDFNELKLDQCRVIGSGEVKPNDTPNAWHLATEPAVAAEGANQRASDWTGLQDGAQRVRAVQALLPSVADAIAALRVDLERAGGNGGEPLQERQQTIETLRALHALLSDIIVLANRDELESQYGLGLLSEARAFAGRIAVAYAGDGFGTTVITISAAVLTYIETGIAGAVLVTAGLAAQFSREER